MHHYGIIGYPIGHTLSPLMHNTAFSLLGLDAVYRAYEVEPLRLAEQVEEFREKGVMGFNVTIPHKQSIIEFLDEVDERAAAIGAVNTVVRKNERLTGYNTDLSGIVESLAPFHTEIAGNAAVLLGAGGSARAVLYALLTHFHPSSVFIAGRTATRAESLAAELGLLSRKTSVRTLPLSETRALHPALAAAALIINATPVGMHPDRSASPLPEDAPLHAGQIVMDLIYAPAETELIRRAALKGARTIGGLEMLVHQGARAFELWTGREMPLERVRSVLERELKRRMTTT